MIQCFQLENVYLCAVLNFTGQDFVNGSPLIGDAKYKFGTSS